MFSKIFDVKSIAKKTMIYSIDTFGTIADMTQLMSARKIEDS